MRYEVSDGGASGSSFFAFGSEPDILTFVTDATGRVVQLSARLAQRLGIADADYLSAERVEIAQSPDGAIRLRNGASELRGLSVTAPIGRGQSLTLVIEADAPAQRSLERLERANRALGDLLLAVGHEVRSPLSAMMASAELIRRDGGTAGKRAEAILAAGQTLSRFLGTLTDFTAVENGGHAAVLRDFDPRDEVERALALFRLIAAVKGLKLEVHIAPETPATMRGDPTRLCRVLCNLLSNAVKFTDAGEVSLRVAPAGRRTRFEVADTGCGMDMGDLLRLLAAAPDRMPRSEHGLGLAICRAIVDEMGGAIEAQSEPGAGVRIRFEVPVAPADIAPCAADPCAP